MANSAKEKNFVRNIPWETRTAIKQDIENSMLDYFDEVLKQRYSKDKLIQDYYIFNLTYYRNLVLSRSLFRKQIGRPKNGTTTSC